MDAAFIQQNQIADASLQCKLGTNEVYERLKGTGKDLTDVASDATDYKALIAKAGTLDDKLVWAQKLATRRLASGVVPELDECFAALDLR